MRAANQPESTGFRAGTCSRGVTQPVSLVYLPVSLTAPGPSGSTGTTRLCRGCSRPPRRPAAQAASSFTQPLRRPGDRGLPPPFGQTAPRGARTWQVYERTIAGPILPATPAPFRPEPQQAGTRRVLLPEAGAADDGVLRRLAADRRPRRRAAAGRRGRCRATPPPGRLESRPGYTAGKDRTTGGAPGLRNTSIFLPLRYLFPGSRVKKGPQNPISGVSAKKRRHAGSTLP